MCSMSEYVVLEFGPIPKVRKRARRKTGLMVLGWPGAPRGRLEGETPRWECNASVIGPKMLI
jgi:hypothetical protein